jgi:hypothetical protein
MNLVETLTGLRSQRDDLERAILAMEAVVANWGTPGMQPSNHGRTPQIDIPLVAAPPEKPQKTMTGWEACRLVLRACGEEMSVPQIVAALEAEGILLGSRDRRAYVSTTLRRREDVFYRRGEGLSVRWGLQEWNPRKRV